MSYVKNTWKDQDVERPRTYEVTNNQDGSITLTDSFGLVTELGTPVNAVNMNHIEDGIEDLYDIKANKDWVIDYSKIAGSHVLEAPNGSIVIDGANVVAKAGLKVLIADGLNADGTYKNFIYTVEEDTILAPFSSQNPGLYFVNGLWLKDDNTLGLSGSQAKVHTYGTLANRPPMSGTITLQYYATDVNKYYWGAPALGMTDWEELHCVDVFKYTNNSITDYYPLFSSLDNEKADGQWVASNTSIQNGAKNAGDYTINLAQILPNDSFAYECIFTCDGYTLGTNGALGDIRLSTTLTPSVFLAKTQTRAAAAVQFGGSANVVVGVDRVATYSVINNNVGNLRIVLASYRRIGTNA